MLRPPYSNLLEVPVCVAFVMHVCQSIPPSAESFMHYSGAPRFAMQLLQDFLGDVFEVLSCLRSSFHCVTSTGFTDTVTVSLRAERSEIENCCTYAALDLQRLLCRTHLA